MKTEGDSAGPFDVVIVGGGAMGCAAAYFLMQLGGPALRVLVCEADPTYAHAATVQAAGGIRQTFSLAENIRMSLYGAEFMRTAAVELAVDGVEPMLSFERKPYLYLAAGAQDVDRLRATYDLRRSLEVPGLWLDRPALAARFPWLVSEDVDAGLLGGAEEGVIDPEALLRALKRKATSLGAVFRAGRVADFDIGGGRVQAVVLESGERIACGAVVNAAGAEAASVAKAAHCDLPVVPRSATTFVFRTAAPLPEDMPVVVDRVQGLHVKREGDVFLASLPGAADHDAFEAAVWPALWQRVPAFEAIRFAGAWTGTIDASPHDGNPFIGPHPGLSNFLSLAGFNGHGLQHAPAAGRAIAEWIVHGGYRAIDLSRFGFDRLGNADPVREYF